MLLTTSWDDGHPLDMRIADLLDKYGLSGTFYVPVRNSEGLPVLELEDLRELDRRFEIGGHTNDHLELTKLDEAACKTQIEDGKNGLEDYLGHETSSFCYVRGSFDETVKRLVREAGYRYGRTTRNMAFTPGSDPYEIPTTLQYYPHSMKHYLRCHKKKIVQRAPALLSLMRGGQVHDKIRRLIKAAPYLGGYVHFWGHSWEIDKLDAWGDLEALLKAITALDMDIENVNNTDMFNHHFQPGEQ